MPWHLASTYMRRRLFGGEEAHAPAVRAHEHLIESPCHVMPRVLFPAPGQCACTAAHHVEVPMRRRQKQKGPPPTRHAKSHCVYVVRRTTARMSCARAGCICVGDIGAQYQSRKKDRHGGRGSGGGPRPAASSTARLSASPRPEGQREEASASKYQVGRLAVNVRTAHGAPCSLGIACMCMCVCVYVCMYVDNPDPTGPWPSRPVFPAPLAAPLRRRGPRPRPGP